MPRYSHPFEDSLRRAIRDTLALDPLITDAALTKTLEKKLEHSFDPRYVGKMRDRVHKQAVAQLDQERIAPRITEIRETYRMVRQKLFQIVFWAPDPANPAGKPPFADEMVNAAKALVELDLKILDAEVSNGFYRKLDAEAEDIGIPMPQEYRRLVVTTFEKWGMLPPGVVKAQVVEQVLEQADHARSTATS